MAKKPEYKAREGSSLCDADAVILGPELKRLAKAGKAGIDSLLEEATKEESPLHDYLTWDKDVAMVKCQKAELRYIARAVEVEVIVNGMTVRQPVLINVKFQVPSTEQTAEAVTVQEYQTPEQVLRNPLSVQSVIENARRDLVSVTQRYRQYLEMFSEFSDEYETLFDTINDLEPAGV